MVNLDLHSAIGQPVNRSLLKVFNSTRKPVTQPQRS